MYSKNFTFAFRVVVFLCFLLIFSGFSFAQDMPSEDEETPSISQVAPLYQDPQPFTRSFLEELNWNEANKQAVFWTGFGVSLAGIGLTVYGLVQSLSAFSLPPDLDLLNSGLVGAAGGGLILSLGLGLIGETGQKLP